MQAIRHHRLFPALFGLWFAALFGLGLLVVPAKVLAHLVSLKAISSAFHIAAALGIAALAGLAAFALARKLAPQRAGSAASIAVPSRHVGESSATSPEAAAEPLLLEVECTSPTALATQHPLESAPLDSLGPVELVERLALSLSKHPAPADLSPLPPLPENLAVVPGETAASTPLTFGKPKSSPRPEEAPWRAGPQAGDDHGENWDDDEEAGEEAEDTESAQDAYSSLLNVRTGRMARVREGVIQLSSAPHEVIPFPLESPAGTIPCASAPSDRESADQALQDALERLQRLAEGR